MKLLLDEQISGKVAERLRKQGHDVVATTDEPALRGLSDPDLFDVAQMQGRVVVTYNRSDFEVIVRDYAESNRSHRGLVIVHPTRFPNSEFDRLAAALAKLIASPSPGPNALVWLQDGETGRGGPHPSASARKTQP